MENDYQRAERRITEINLQRAATADGDVLSEPGQLAGMVTKASTLASELQNTRQGLIDSGNLTPQGIGEALAEPKAAALQQVNALREGLNKKADALAAETEKLTVQPPEFNEQHAAVLQMFANLPSDQKAALKSQVLLNPAAHPELANALAACPDFASVLSPSSMQLLKSRMLPADVREKQNQVAARAESLRKSMLALNSVAAEINALN